MQLRDSGMPDERYWETLFDVPRVLSRLGIDGELADVVELGCGYGTFTLPIARKVSGKIFTFDIDPAMVARTKERCRSAGLVNVDCRERDVVEQGFGMAGNADAVLLFNILHCENPQSLLEQAAAAIRAQGWLFVIHWRFDAETPRGPSLDIRPRPDQIVDWARQTGWIPQGEPIDLPPWHYGLKFRRSSM